MALPNPVSPTAYSSQSSPRRSDAAAIMTRLPARLAAGAFALLRYMIAAILLLIMLLTVVDVCGRYFLAKPLPGALEITEMLLGALIFSALPHVTAAREHVAIDLLDRFFTGFAKKVQDIAVALVTCACCAFLSYRLWLLAERIHSTGETTATLGVPIYPLAYGIAIMVGASAACALLTIGAADSDTAEEAAHV